METVDCKVDCEDDETLNFRIVNLQDSKKKIFSFADARNEVLDTLNNQEYVLWKSEDEEFSDMLLHHLEFLMPQYPYYAIRRINLWNGKYWSSGNPEYSAHLVSNQVRYIGDVHERLIPRKPYGKIDFPIIHNHSSKWAYTSGWKNSPVFIPVLAMKKAFEVTKENLRL